MKTMSRYSSIVLLLALFIGPHSGADVLENPPVTMSWCAKIKLGTYLTSVTKWIDAKKPACRWEAFLQDSRPNARGQRLSSKSILKDITIYSAHCDRFQKGQVISGHLSAEVDYGLSKKRELSGSNLKQSELRESPCYHGPSHTTPSK